MAIYLDTSVLAHAILGTDTTALKWFTSASVQDTIISSTLLRLEISRLLRRESLDPSLADPHMERIALVSINDQILRFAGTFVPHINTLHSIHVATLLYADPEANLATHDITMLQAARNLGITSFDPLED